MHKALRETFGLVQTLDEQAAEDFHDHGGIGSGERQELSVATENAIRNQGMGVRVEVGAIGAVVMF